MGVLLFSALVMHWAVDETSSPEGLNGMTYIKETILNLKLFFQNKSHLLWFISSVSLINFHFIIIMWTPYFLSKVGFSSYISTVSIIYPLMSCLSSFVSYSFTYCSYHVEKWLMIFFIFILGFEVGLFTLGND